MAILFAGSLASCSQGQTEVDVFAASSLTDAFAELEARYEAANPDVDIRLNVAGSNTLLRQIIDGAEAEVFAPADVSLFSDQELLEEYPLLSPTLFASNTLVAIVPIDSDITTIEQMLRPGLTLARCAAGVPCGMATDDWLQASGAELARASIEPSVRSVLTKVRLQEADGGFVYQTDAQSASKEVRVIDLATGGAPSPKVSLGIAILSNAATSDSAGSGTNDTEAIAEDFVQFILSEEAADVLAELGFDRP